MMRFLGKLFGRTAGQPDGDVERTQIVQSLSSAGLGRLAADVLRLASPSLRLVPIDAPAAGVAPGISRLGGQPDLPPAALWPVWKGLPMSFVGQLRLEDVAGHDPQRRLPPTGLLSFFYDARQETYGADPDDRGGWEVQYHPEAPSAWQVRAFPADLPAESRFKPVGVSCHPELSLPSAPTQADPGLSWSDAETEGYENWLVERFSPAERGQPHHRLFGWPDQIQDDMQAQCALASHGYHNLDDPGAAAALQGKADWSLLLQVDSDERAAMRWGSAGMIYYWIEKAALREAQYNRAWLVLQSD
jgi:uncharacterized protein YwqG